MPTQKALASYFPLPPTFALLRSPLPTSHEAVFPSVLFWNTNLANGWKVKSQRDKESKRQRGERSFFWNINVHKFDSLKAINLFLNTNCSRIVHELNMNWTELMEQLMRQLMGINGETFLVFGTRILSPVPLSPWGKRRQTSCIYTQRGWFD